MYDLHEPAARQLAAQMMRSVEAALTLYAEGALGHNELLQYAIQSGHRTRPAGCLLACAATGGEWQAALDGAVAVELIHKSSNIRDDVADGDRARSGHPAFHVAYGLEAALGVSDVLWSSALKIVQRLPEAVRDTCLAATTSMLSEMAAAQLEDVCPSPQNGSVKDRLAVAEAKTGAISGLACRLGAILGGGDKTVCDALDHYGRNLGTAFQLLNDDRNLRGEEKLRVAGSDLQKGRDTVLTAYARACGAIPDGEFPPQPPNDLTEEAASELRALVLASGAPEAAKRMAAELLTTARSHLTRLRPSLARNILESLTRDALVVYAF